MNRVLLASIVAFGLVALAAPAQAGPPCTCDPNPVTDLVRCLANGTDCPPVLDGADLPPLKDLDPRNWPCACDPQDPW
jgi:hypothetical protein